jgi:WD40 repeat protein
MASSTENLLELARNSNSEAIRILINNSVKLKGIAVTYANVSNGCLEIIVESTQIPDEKSLVSFIHRGMLKLDAKAIYKVIVHGKQIEEMLPSWSKEFEIVPTKSLTTAKQKKYAEADELQNKILSQSQLPSLPSNSSQLPEWKCAYSLTGHSGIIYSLAVCSSGKFIVSSSQDKTIKIWNLSTGHEIPSYMQHSDFVYSVAISQDGEILASGSADGVIIIWRTKKCFETLPKRYSLFQHSGKVHSLAISSDKKTLVSGGSDSKIKVWDLNLSKDIFTLLGHSECIWSVAISPDGKIFASGSGDNTIKIWHLNTGKLIHTLVGHLSAVNSVAFSPDGKILASGSLDKTVKIWNLTSASLIQTLPSCEANVTSVAFSPDGNNLASATGNNTVQIWDIADGRLICELNEHSLDNWSEGLMTGLIANLGFASSTVLFSSDGYTLVTTTLKKIKIWQHSSIFKPLIVSSSPDNLDSAVAMDYSRLRDLLAAGKWVEADWETSLILLKVSQSTMAGCITVKDIQNFPSEDLCTIDRLWTKYSNGHFGFSAQKRIWQSLGGKSGVKYKVYDKFGERVGWRVNGQWLARDRHKFTLTAPEGHLPQLTPPGIFCSFLGAFMTGLFGGSLGIWCNAMTTLFSREELS